MKEAYYFSHDSNARFDDKILEMRSEFGWEGYGIYWALIEILRDQSFYNYDLAKIKGLALSLNVDFLWFENYFKKCTDLGLFTIKDDYFYSESLLKRVAKIDEFRAKRAEAGRMGGIAKAKLKQSHSKTVANPSNKRKVKESKGKENIFVVPTIEEIKAYIKEMNLSINADAYFFSRSESEWERVNGQKVKSWKLDLQNANTQGYFQSRQKSEESPYKMAPLSMYGFEE